jgi:uncharacterized protein YegP (UPF0339 family)
MYILELYQLKSSGRWRWKLSTNNGRTIARADYHYASRHAALRSFRGMQECLKEHPISVSIWRAKEITYWKEL